MRGLLYILSGLLILGSNAQVFSSSIEYQKALQYLEERGEVYFQFSANSPAEINKLNEIISVDKVEYPLAYAYANKAGFAGFLEAGLEYATLTPPGLLGPAPQMSDYAEFLKGGAPADWDRYPSYTSYLEIMEKFETDHPELCKLYKYGTSERGRDLLIMKVSDNVETEEKEPNFIWTGTIHGDETLGYMNSLHMIDYLCTNYGNDETVDNIVDNIEVWIAPLTNPDGTYNGGNNSVSGARRYNANNRDLNRNFPTPSRPYGNYSAWEDEVKYMKDFEEKHNFVMGLDIHGGMENVVYPWAYTRRYHVDQEWWEYVGGRYADLAHSNSPSGYFTTTQSDGVGSAGSDYYTANGTRIDFPVYGTSCRAVTLEQNTQKLLSESKLLDYWEYNREAMLQLMLETLNGVQGTVTDTFSGEPLVAKVYIENHDDDSSHVYSDSMGIYHRPIYAGTYNFTFTSGDYHPKTVRNVRPKNGEPLVLDVQLVPPTGITNNLQPVYISISVKPMAGGVKIDFGKHALTGRVGIYDLQGKIIRDFPAKQSHEKVIFWDGSNANGQPVSSGCYLVKIAGNEGNISKSFLYHR